MDLNLIVMAGRLANDAELKAFESGATLARLLVVVKSEEPRHRIDVVPVVMWDPDADDVATWTRGERVWIAGSVQRRFWSMDDDRGRQSRIEIVAREIQISPKDSEWAEEKVKYDGVN